MYTPEVANFLANVFFAHLDHREIQLVKKRALSAVIGCNLHDLRGAIPL